MKSPAHGAAIPRGLAAPPGPASGRFGRLFPFLPRHDAGAKAVEVLARAMIAQAGFSLENNSIPAGYTYLGQFIDHDITFDPTSRLEQDNDPGALANFRTPRYDLDSLYGAGPVAQPFLYDWDKTSGRGVKLLVDGFDLPRNRQGRALIGDARNDENVIVSQLRGLFLRFHNAVVDDLGGVKAPGVFDRAQRLVRWHYQWIVVNDFLPTLIGTPPAAPRLYAWPDDPSVPVEFSGAAFRFGHSMVREDYELNDEQVGVPPFRTNRRAQHLGGFRPLQAELHIKWRRFFAVPGQAAPSMFSMSIDTSLAKVLTNLRGGGTALARRNLRRGRALGLPAGADVARAIGEPPLTEEQLGLDTMIRGNDAALEALLRATPLWFYVLREAETRRPDGRRHSEADGGNRLGPVGGRIVREVLLGLLEGDPSSYLRQQPDWTPTLPRDKAATFTMGDLVKFTEPPL